MNREPSAMSSSSESESNCDRTKELKAFDDTKEGVKGLVDAGVVTIPKIFMRPSPPDEIAEKYLMNSGIKVPVIDMSGIRNRKDIVEEVRIASETWGFFQVVNHGIPLNVLQDMIEGVRMFNEQDPAVRKDYYSRDPLRKVKFNSNYDLYQSRAANWRDTLIIMPIITSDGLDPQELPAVCREATSKYIKAVIKVGDALLELLSEALGLKPDYLRAMEFAKESTMACHYYPPCPEPQLTMGISKHTDPDCLTILLQDQIGGLQVLHDNQYWVDVHPIPGSLIINIGDFLQVMSNGKLKSVYHRVIAGHAGPRISTAYFVSGISTDPARSCGPLKELISKENPPVYRDFLVADYIGKFLSRALDDRPCLDYFKL